MRDLPRKKIVAAALTLVVGAGTATAVSQAGPRVYQKGKTSTGQSVTVIGQPGQSVTTGGGTAAGGAGGNGDRVGWLGHVEPARARPARAPRSR